MTKKMLVIAIAITVFAVAIVGGTMAFLTAEHGERNTMTVGKVDIVQHEEQRIFVDGQYTGEAATQFIDRNSPAIIPALYTVDEQGDPNYTYDGKIELGNNSEYSIWNETISGEIDKFVFVQNNGTVDAYIRTIIAFEDKLLTNGHYVSEYMNYSFGNVNTLGSETESTTAAWDINGTEPFPTDKDIVWLMSGDKLLTVEISDDPSNPYSGKTTFTIAIALYDRPIPSNTFTEPSLMQFWLDTDAPNEWFLAVGSEYDVICLSQAVQANFPTALDALDAAFPLSAENLVTWLSRLN